LGGTTFTLQLTLAESVMTEDPALQASIQMENKYVSNHLDNFLKKAEAVKTWITKGDKEEFIAHYTRVQSSLFQDADFQRAYERIYKALETLQ